MDNIYIEYKFTVSPKEPATEILIAELGSVGFESFVETEEGVVAYIQKQDWNSELLSEIFVLILKSLQSAMSKQKLPKRTGMQNGKRILKQL